MIERYPSTPYIRQLTQANGWHRELIPDRHGEPVAIVAVRVGPRWTDSVAIEAEWTAHLGTRRMGQLRDALTRLREITDPYL